MKKHPGIKGLLKKTSLIGTTMMLAGFVFLTAGCGQDADDTDPAVEENQESNSKTPSVIDDVVETVTGARAIRTGEKLKEEIREIERQQEELLKDFN